MDKQQAQKIIKHTFENPFDKNMFVSFIKNLLNQIEESHFSYRGNLIPDAFEHYISTLERIGKYTDGTHKIDILVVKLKKETSIEHARTMQRNFIAWYLNGSRGGEMKDAAFAAFVAPNDDDWRFSLVKMDYKFEQTPSGKMKIKEDFTPARRWSFLVGSNEASHTAQSQLVPIMADDTHNPTLAELEKAFNIETVTKEFFEKYRDLFLKTKEELDAVAAKDEKIKTDFATKGVNTVDFAKKLLGQIVFLYFLQKKGWFGVERDKEWGTGPKNFLRLLFNSLNRRLQPSADTHPQYNRQLQPSANTIPANQNFFNDILEPLFYNTLAVERTHNYSDRFNCKIPFLNGGLFDPINNYDWVHTDILLPNEIFSNTKKTKEGDTGDGIFDVFDRYNFTVKEDEPLEKEVAIDPEMLGKVFENLLEIKDRKSRGTYYTPREIVHYMCQESLINYLATELAEIASPPEQGVSQNPEQGAHQPFEQGVVTPCNQMLSHISPCSNENTSSNSNTPTTACFSLRRSDLETLIKHGETYVEHDTRVIKKGRETATYPFKMPESIRKNAKLIDEKLSDIKVCDPAVGSGAFLVGMMNEIVRARNTVGVYLPLRGAAAAKQSHSLYTLKRHAIQNSLYGVDIDPCAVEIAKLRLWLSLVVDEEDIKQIKPLPNLDYKIMQGNSLISEFLGIDLDTTGEKKEAQTSLFKDDVKDLFVELEKSKSSFLNQPHKTEKENLRTKIENLIIQIFENKLKEQKEIYSRKLGEIEKYAAEHPNIETGKKYKKTGKEKLFKKMDFNLEEAETQLRNFTSNREVKPFFLWKLYFSEIFHEQKIEKDWRVYHITWVTHNRHISNRMASHPHTEQGVVTPCNIVPPCNKEKILPYLTPEQETEITRYIADIIEEDKLKLLAYNICGNHIHLVIVCEEDKRDNIIRKLKGNSTQLYKLNNNINKEFHLWAQKYNCSYIEDEKKLSAAVEYVLHNREKHNFPANKGLQSLVQRMVVPYDKAFAPAIDKGGFDVVIGNPPYGANLTTKEKTLYKTIYNDVHIRTPDSFNYFISKAFRILNIQGTLSFIVSNNLFFQNEYLKTRNLFLNNKKIVNLINLGDAVFEYAIVPSCVFIVKNCSDKEHYFGFADLRNFKGDLRTIDFNEFLKICRKEDVTNTPGIVFGVDKLSLEIIQKIESISCKIDDIAEEVASGISTGGDKIFRISKQQCKKFDLEKEILYKVLVGKELHRYKIENNEFYVIYTDRNTQIEKLPRIFNYLKPFKPQLNKRSETKAGILNWWCLNRQRYKELFLDEKIILRQTADNIIAAYDNDGYFVLDSILVVKLKKDSEYSYKYVLSILNSSVCNFIYQQITQEEGRIFAQVKPKNIRKLYIPKITKGNYQTFVFTVDCILALTQSDDYLQNHAKQAQVKQLEREIDQMVYELYDLTDEEIKIIEDSINKK